MSYNAETHVLTIVFRGKRGVYRYFDVPPEEYAAFRSAPSKGVYLNEIFKPKEYRYAKVSPAYPKREAEPSRASLIPQVRP
jgi:hypothetical protein